MTKNSDKETTHLNFCLSIDIFNNSVLSAPRSYKKRRKVIGFACDEINRVWDSI